ncbi:MAG: LCP family protein [Armatimonadetes bacterium]|nr:LCP family protein [Armatimonadota bacterium]
MKGTSWVAAMLVILLGSAVGIAAGTFLAVWLPTMKATHTTFGDFLTGAFGGQRYVRILMIGEDDTARRSKNGNGLSDTLVVLALDTQTKEIRALSIPRDTRVEIPGHGICKINSAHVYGGPQLTKQVVQDLLGVPIEKYVKTNTHGLRGIVDLVGGVYIKVDKDMHYVDRHGGLYINLKASPEKQLLNGKQAEGYVRFRHDKYGDSGYEIINGKKVPAGRIARQQIFLRALANRILSLPTKRERARVLETAYNRGYVVSDLNMKDWDGLADFFKDIKPENITMEVLPGRPGMIGRVSYWLPDTKQLAQVVSVTLLFQEPNPKVEVLNGSGVAGAAKKIADQLIDAGYEVTRTDNAPKSDYYQSQIITRKGKTEAVMRLAKLIGCDLIIEDGAQKKSGPDVTVIVGKRNAYH